VLLSGPKTAPGPGRERPATLGGVTGKLVQLYKLTDVDAAPTAVQVSETTKAERELAQLTASWDALRNGDLAALNAALTAGGLTAIRPELAPETRQDDGDME